MDLAALFRILRMGYFVDSARLDLVSVLPASVRNCGFLTWFPGFLVSLYLTPHSGGIICPIPILLLPFATEYSRF